MDYQEVLSIILLGSLREIESPCDNGLSVNDHDLDVCYGGFILQIPISFFRLLC